MKHHGGPPRPNGLLHPPCAVSVSLLSPMPEPAAGRTTLGSASRNALLFGVGNAGQRLAGFLLTPVYTFSLSLSDYGLLMTIMVTTQVLVLSTALGTPTGFMRLASECETRNELGRLVLSTILLQTLSAVIVSGMLLAFLQPLFRQLFHTDHVTGLLVMAGAVALFLSLFESVLTVYRYQGEGLRFILACAVVFCALTGLTVLLVRVAGFGIAGALGAQIGAYGGTWIILMIAWARRTRLGFSAAITKSLFKFSFPLVFSSASNMLGDVSAVYFLSYFVSLEQVSIFSLALKITGIAGIVLTMPFLMAYEPYVYRHIAHPELDRNISRILSFIVVAFAFTATAIVFVFRDLLHLIAPPDYYPAYSIVFLLLPALVFRCVYYIGESLANIEKRTQAVAALVTSINLISIAANYYLIQIWGLTSAVIMLNGSMAGAGIGLLLLGRRYHPIPLEWGRIGTGMVLMLALLSLAYGLHSKASWVFYSVVPLAAGASALGLWVWFCTDEEKAAFREVYRTWRRSAKTAFPSDGR